MSKCPLLLTKLLSYIKMPVLERRWISNKPCLYKGGGASEFSTADNGQNAAPTKRNETILLYKYVAFLLLNTEAHTYEVECLPYCDLLLQLHSYWALHLPAAYEKH